MYCGGTDSYYMIDYGPYNPPICVLFNYYLIDVKYKKKMYKDCKLYLILNTLPDENGIADNIETIHITIND